LFIGIATVGRLSDLWNYNTITNEWTWVSGPTSLEQPAHYGEIGVPHPDNNPGARYGGCMWEDDDGSLWIFGGYGRSPNGLTGILIHFCITNL